MHSVVPDPGPWKDFPNMETPAPDDLLTTSAAGRILGLSPDMVRILNDKGILPALKTVNGYRLFRRADVDKLRSEREQSRAARRAVRRA